MKTIHGSRSRVFIASIVMCLAVALASGMDQARVETGVDKAVAQLGVDGSGVLVALLDRGIDWRNNDFRKADGSTRIKYIFDLTDDSGANAADNTFGKGTIYTETQINAALNGGTALPFRDAVGHGTTTAGISTGNGRNLAKYRGVAPGASLIVVKVTSDGAPAHDNQPAEAAFYDPARIPIAMDFVKAKATELSMPCVMLLNLGSIGGPTDGTSEIARKIDSIVGAGIPGLVFVTGTGDDGGVANRAGGLVPKGGSITLQINKTQSTPMALDLWYPEGDPNQPSKDNLDVSIHTPSGDYGPFPAPAGPNGFDDRPSPAFDYYHRGSNANFENAINGKRNIYIYFKEGAGAYSVTLSGANLLTGDRRFDATINPSNIHQQPGPNVFMNFIAPGSISDFSTALNNICPADYVIRTQWTDVDGVPRSLTGEGNIGEIWKGSSTGPTFDGRIGVDVCAPGDSVFTTYNPTSYFATFRFNLIQDGNGFYGRASAVSAASPQVTGIIALMLQKNPQLDAPTVKHILQETARRDSFTGSTPNTTWGYGKVDAFAAVQRAIGAQLLNISTRMRVLSGDQVLIGGFIITGTDPKKVIIRGMGPSLNGVGVTLSDPTLELHQGSTTLATNDNWKINDQTGQSQEADIRATTIPPTNDLESAIVATLPPGNYTAILAGKNGGTGVGVVEVYDLAQGANSKLANISSRGFVDTNDNVMIGGLIVGGGSGGGTARVIVRAIGPSLSVSGALGDPTLELHDVNGTTIATNDNWKINDQTGQSQQAEIEATTIPPTDDLESALVATLAPGNYTAIVRGKNNTTGVGLVEVYALN
jgi:minor extracellular serine protease Vpr